MYLPIAKIFALLVVLVPLISAQFEEELYPTTKWYMRAPRSISGLFRRLIGRRKNTYRTGFQGTAIANGPYSSQPSSYYSSFLSNPFASGSSPSSSVASPGFPGASGQAASGLSGFSSNLWSPNLSSYTNVVQGVGSAPAAGTNYPTYSPPASGPGAGNPNNVDFHAVLDQFVRSAGLSPTGDQDTSASTIQSKGDSPVFSFKKLYSFPFYLSTDQQPADQGFNLQIPYMRKHIRRALHEGSAKNPKFFADKQSIQNWLHPKNWYYGQQALQQSASSLIPTTSNVQWPNGQEINAVINGGQRFFRGKQPVGHNQGLMGHQLPHHQGIPAPIGSPVVPISGVPSPLPSAGSPKPGHHQPQQGQKIASHPQLPVSQSQSSSSSSSVSSVSSASSSPVASIANQPQSAPSSQQQPQQQQSATSAGQLTDPSILSSQAFIAQYLQEQLAASNQKQPNGLSIKDDQEPNESQFASAYYFPTAKVQQQQQPQPQQGKQHQSPLISGQEKGQLASGITSSSSVSSSSTLVSGDSSSPLSSYQVSYSSGGYGASSS